MEQGTYAEHVGAAASACPHIASAPVLSLGLDTVVIKFLVAARSSQYTNKTMRSKSVVQFFVLF